MTTTFRWFTARWRWILLPVLAFVALVSWAFASPIGAGPDDDYHLVSTWCAGGGSEQCEPGSAPDLRIVPQGFEDLICFAQEPAVSAACQQQVWATWNDSSVETRRGNFYGEYPPAYYGFQRMFAGDDVQFSALVMRVANAALFVSLATALAVLSTPSRRRTLVLGWMITLVPLGVFLIPSNNPSGWAVTGVGTAFIALLGWFESLGRRRWALGALYLTGVVMAAGARGDAAVYIVGASVVAMLLTASRQRAWMLRAALPLAGMIIAAMFLAAAGQAGVATSGFTSDGGGVSVGLVDAATPPTGLGLAAYNLLMLPFLWTGVWGSWGLGWLDTMLPPVVAWSAVAAFVAVGFGALARASVRKLVALAGVFAVLVILPVYVLTTGGDMVGENLQPRYLLPLIVLLGVLLVTESGGPVQGLGRVQATLVIVALSVANFVSLQVNIRRYVTGYENQGLDLGAGAEWWWSSAVLGPNAVWLIGSLAFAGALILTWPLLREGVVAQPRTAEHRNA